MNKLILLTCLLFSFSVSAKKADCHSWPMNMAEVWLKNNNIADITHLDRTKTEIKQLAAQKKAGGITTEIWHFIFHDNSGKAYEVITQSDANLEECSASEVNVFLIASSTINH